MSKIGLQELYDKLYLEAAARARKKGDKPPDEVEVFKVLHKSVETAVLNGEESSEALDELKEVQSFHIREVEEEKRKDEVDKALREGSILDLDSILN